MDKLKKAGMVIAGIFAVLLIAGIVSSLIPEEVPQKSEVEMLTEERERFPSSICERWKVRYPIIPKLSSIYELKSKNRFMELNPDEWSREIVFLKKTDFLISEPMDIILNDDVITISPGEGLIDLTDQKKFRIRGEGCILFL